MYRLTALLTTASWRSGCYGDGKFGAVPDGKSIDASSTDGINWTQSYLPSIANWYSVCYGDGTFVATSTSNVVAYDDGEPKPLKQIIQELLARIVALEG